MSIAPTDEQPVKSKTFEPLRIGGHTLRVPLVQGGMGVRISASRLAGAVAACGGVGTIAAVGIGQASRHYDGSNLFESNLTALSEEIRGALAIAPGGVISVNCMAVLTDYDNLVRASAVSGASVITSGAGLPLHLPALTRDFPNVALVPIVSSLKAARLIVRRWERDYGRLPDAIVNEEPATAGGHLGAKLDQLDNPALLHETVVPELVEFVRKDLRADVPVIAAGGIWDRSDIDRVTALGARGVQLGTRFVCTHECDAPMAFKQAYLDATEGDIALVMSPAGLPGRALLNEFLRNVNDGFPPNDPCFANCLYHCGFKEEGSGFCIATAMVNAQQGRREEGLIFCGSNAHRCDRIVHVAELIEELFPAA